MDTNKVLRVLIYIGLFASLAIPLYVSSGLFFPFITGKNFAFRIIVEIVGALWLILWARDHNARDKRSWLTSAVALFLVVIAAATFLGENPYRSFWSNYERMDGLINLLHQGLYFVVLASVLRTKEMWNRFFHASMLVAFIISCYGIGQLMGKFVINQGGVRLDATFGNSTYLAVYMLFHVFIAAYYFFGQIGFNWKRVLYGVLTVLYASMLYHTATRGVILGLIAGTLVALAIVGYKSKGKIRTFTFGAVGAIFVLGLLFFGLRNTSFIKNNQVLGRFASISLTETTTQSRFVIWGMALKGWQEHPLLGWGSENFNLVFNKYYEPTLWRNEAWFDRAHNAFFDWLIAGGLLGLLSYLSMFAAAIYLLWRKESSFSLAEQGLMTGLLVGYFIQNLFVFDNLTSYMYFFIILAFIHNRTKDSHHGTPLGVLAPLDKVRSDLHRFMSGNYQAVVNVLVALVLLFAVYFVNYKPIEANMLMLHSLYPRALEDKNFTDISKVFALHTLGSTEAREQLLFMLSDYRNQQNVDQNKLIRFLDLGKNQMEEQLKQSANDARHQLFYGSFLQSYGQIDEAKNHFLAARTLSPKKQLVLFSLASVYIQEKNYNEALTVSKEAFDYDPTYDQARIQYAIALVYSGKDMEAEQLLAERYGTASLPDANLVQAYVATGQIAKVITIWKKFLAEQPTNPQAYLALAAAYYTAHRDAEAIATLQKMSILGDEAKKAADYYIDAIKKGTMPR